MQITVLENPEELAQAAAEKIISLVSSKPNAVLCLAGGETPRLTYQYLTEEVKKKSIDFSAVQWISLDEWAGIPKSNPGSCYYFLQQSLFDPLAVNPVNIHFFDAMASDLPAECDKINTIIQQHQAIDLMLVGIGINGHIGFNEPGIDPALQAHVIELDQITQQVGQKYFTAATTLQKGITLGMAQFLQSRMAVLIASGTKKAGIVKKAIGEPVSTTVPASYIQAHKNAWVLLDREAASAIKEGK
jgi:glucosamine-6-phosphate isomerase